MYKGNGNKRNKDGIFAIGMRKRRMVFGCSEIRAFPHETALEGTQEVQLDGGQWPLDTPGQGAGHVYATLMDASN